MRWELLCGSLSILWHWLSLGLEWKLTFSSPVATAEFFKFACILSSMSRNTWSNRQIWLWNMEWRKGNTNRVLLENALVIVSTHFQQHKRRFYMWTSPDGQHRNQIDYIFCSQRWRSSIQSAKTRPRADCGSDHELLIAKFRLKLKKVGKTTRPFRCELNQIP